MPYQTTMLPEGAVPSGLEKESNWLDAILKGAEKFVPAYTDAKEKTAKNEKEKVDMYIDLRKAGYSKDEAYDATLKGTRFDKPSGEITDSDTPYKLKNKVKMSIYNNERLSDKDYDFALREGIDVPDSSLPESVFTEQAKKGKKKSLVTKGVEWLTGFLGKSKKGEDGGADRRERARALLIKEQKLKGTEAQVDLFLKNNPSFK